MLPKPFSCTSCLGSKWDRGAGYVPATGTGDNGVLILAEAAGEQETKEGMPLVGKAGYYLFQNLQRINIEREGFKIHNILSCRPPDNKLAKMPYELEVINNCAPNWHKTVIDHVAHAREIGKTPVIVTLGRIPFKAVMGLNDRDAVMRYDYQAYPHWHADFGCWVLAADHPAYLMRGNNHLLPVLQYVFQRALEIAANGLNQVQPQYILDPRPETFASWVSTYKQYLASHPDTVLSYDIETPYKSGKDEEKVAREDDADYTILRVGLAYIPNQAVSIPWNAAFKPYLEDLFSTNGAKVGWNNCPTPDQRVLTTDLRWIQAKDLTIGDKLVGFDESVQTGSKLRRYTPSQVTALARAEAPVLRVWLSDGTNVKVTADHPWLVRTKQGYEWVKTRELRNQQKIRRLLPTWEPLQTVDSGWLAGFYAGEGCIDKDNLRVQVTQAVGPTLVEACDKIRACGFSHSKYKTPKRAKDSHIAQVQIVGGSGEAARFLGTIRPQRLLSKFVPEQLGAAWAWTHPLRILSIEDIGMQEIVRIETDTHTYMLEGFGAHNCNYDSKRVRIQMPMKGDEIDAMLAWHVLNSALPKGLGFVTPFYAQSTSMWKHLSDQEPAFYNAKDADMALINYLGIKRDLHATDLGKVFDRHVIQLNRVLAFMSDQGVLRDELLRASSEIKLQTMLDEVEAGMVESIPQEARKYQVYKKTPKSTDGMIQVERVMPVKRCPTCWMESPKKAHFKPVSARKAKLGLDSMCENQTPIVQNEVVKLWAKPLEWKVSKVGLSSYQKALKHQAIINRREGKVTFDEDAIKKLVKTYPNDPLYPSILKHREYTKLLGTYIGITNPVSGIVRGGMAIGRDGRIHPEVTHNPSTLRLACQNPNMQNLPRAKKQEDLQTIVRNLIIASPGNILLELDFSAIEAVLVGYFAGLPDYIRLSKMGIHSYLASHVLERPADLNWSDADLKAYFGEIKKSKDQYTQDVYNGCKRAIHLSGYGGTPKKMNQAEPDIFKTVKDAERMQGIYFDLFPAVKKWQLSCQLQADKDGFLRNPFGYIHRFYRVFSYKKEFGKWVRTQGDDQNKVLAFLPQSTAAGIIKEAMLRLYFERFEEAGQYLRLTVHDSLLADVPLSLRQQVHDVMWEEMTRPVTELALPTSYNMGPYLSIGVEAKEGERWGSMR